MSFNKVSSPQENRILENKGKISFAGKDGKESRLEKIYQRFGNSKSTVDV